MSDRLISICTFAVITFLATSSSAAIVVAAVDSLPEEKSKADFVCDGVGDQEELSQSLAKARIGEMMVDMNPKTQRVVKCAVNHAVEWLPGTYQLSSTLQVPDAANCVIRAEGTTLNYQPEDGDAVLIRGMNRCRYSFGTIKSNSTGAAIRIRPTAAMPSLMSFINFTGLIGRDQQGTGLVLDPTEENICVNRIEGTDILGFNRGVYVGSVGAREGGGSSHGKCDTNWFWLSYIRLCNVCIQEAAEGVDDSVWRVNVDASVPNSVAIRAAGAYGKWYIIMGTYTFEKKNKALILEPGLRHSVFEMHPPLQEFAWEDRSGNNSNVILSTQTPPYRPFTELKSLKP